MRAYGDLVHDLTTAATAAFLDWLSEGWIVAQGEWNVHKARVEVMQDWYTPCWIVTFTIDHPPWFGDSISVEVEEIGNQRFAANIDGMNFAKESIFCCHQAEDVPEGHWVFKG